MGIINKSAILVINLIHFYNVFNQICKLIFNIKYGLLINYAIIINLYLKHSTFSEHYHISHSYTSCQESLATKSHLLNNQSNSG